MHVWSLTSSPDTHTHDGAKTQCHPEPLLLPMVESPVTTQVGDVVVGGDSVLDAFSVRTYTGQPRTPRQPGVGEQEQREKPSRVRVSS